ncbi:unnamed protein product [Prunus armeniaca]
MRCLPCGGAWAVVAVMHWVPMHSPNCHECVGVFGFEFGYRLSLERILPILRFPSLMSDLIRSRRAVSTAPTLAPPAQPASAATIPALMDHVPVGPWGSQAPASLASSVVLPVSARRRHRPASTTDTASTDDTGASVSQPGIDIPSTKNTRGPCRQLKTAKVTRVTNSRISIGYDECHRAAPTAELHSSLAHDIGHVVRTHCPM